MNQRKNLITTVFFVLSVSLLAASLTALLMHRYYSRTQFQILGNICQAIAEDLPDAESEILSVLKRYQHDSPISVKENILLKYGYRQTDFLQVSGKHIGTYLIIGFFSSAILFLVSLWLCHQRETSRIQSLTAYLEKINSGQSGVLFQIDENDVSKLQDEIYKTVTALYQTRDAALNARDHFAKNLSNIAHQLKTPITSISLSTQMMKDEPSPRYLAQINRQLSRLTHLEESLLLLSRIDAGALPLERKAVDVFTLLTLAAENLQELFSKTGVIINIPESGEVTIHADLEWTMEAVMNLFKNCMEHTPKGGCVHCSYEQNPLYTKIRIWDTGTGFSKKDLSHLFERFYRGENAKGNGIGIGLSLSKAIIESQNGTLSAENLPEGGACFEIRLYSH